MQTSAVSLAVQRPNNEMMNISPENVDAAIAHILSLRFKEAIKHRQRSTTSITPSLIEGNGGEQQRDFDEDDQQHSIDDNFDFDNNDTITAKQNSNNDKTNDALERSVSLSFDKNIHDNFHVPICYSAVRFTMVWILVTSQCLLTFCVYYWIKCTVGMDDLMISADSRMMVASLIAMLTSLITTFFVQVPINTPM